MGQLVSRMPFKRPGSGRPQPARCAWSGSRLRWRNVTVAVLAAQMAMATAIRAATMYCIAPRFTSPANTSGYWWYHKCCCFCCCRCYWFFFARVANRLCLVSWGSRCFAGCQVQGSACSLCVCSQNYTIPSRAPALIDSSDSEIWRTWEFLRWQTLPDPQWSNCACAVLGAFEIHGFKFRHTGRITIGLVLGWWRLVWRLCFGDDCRSRTAGFQGGCGKSRLL